MMSSPRHHTSPQHNTSPQRQTWSRRDLLAGTTALAGTVLVRQAEATPASESAAIRAFAGRAEIRPGRVRLEVPALVENGNSVPLTVSVASPMSETDHVRRIALFNEKNPLPNILTVHLGPRSGRAAVSTRIRLSDTQRLTAVAEMSDGTYWSAGADIVVTLAACTEG